MRRQREQSVASLVVVFIAVLLLVSLSACTGVDGATAASRRRHVAVGTRSRRAASRHARLNALTVRGGSDASEYDESEEEGEDALEAAGSSAVDIVLGLSKRVVVLLGKTALNTVKATSRALAAAFQGEEEESQEEGSVLTTLVKAVQRMWSAVLNPSSQSTKASKSAAAAVKKPSASASSLPSKVADFGSFLSNSYGVKATRDQLDPVPVVLGGSIGDALKIARSKARLLVVLVPDAKPSKKGQTADQQAVESFLSLEVAKTAKKRAIKAGETGSFVLWSAKAGSPEAAHALKRLKVKAQKRPTLLVAYPAQGIDSNGSAKMVPRLLAQHHCNPPPLPEQMAAWLNALRKRHAKQYSTMQLELRESQMYQDRKEGYIDSMQSDKDRKQRELKEKKEQAAMQQVEQERQKAMVERRKELLASLPDEPGKDVVGAKTVALRLADGQSSQRKFAPDVPLSTLFDWADATFEIERETVVLTTMNGQQSFSWDEDDSQTLEDAGLGRMVGLRVSVESNSSSEADESSDVEGKAASA